MPTIDLNCDMGESFGVYTLGADEAVMASVSSANIACGFHAGDPTIIRRTIRLARAAGVAIGAHPGFPDLAGFGRREMRVEPADVENMVLYQIGAVAALARSEGMALSHVKPHGALYNLAVRNPALADAVARAVAAFDASLILFGLPGSEIVRAGEARGLATAREGFSDRSYEPDGALTPRSRGGAVIDDIETVAARAVRMATEGTVVAADGSVIPMRVETICTHGDTPGAQQLTGAIRRALERAGVAIARVSRPPR